MASKTRIIIAEDNPRDREYLLKTLLDYQLELTDSATKALEIAREYSEPYIISDLQMPEMNGVELAKQIWQEQSVARILFWSHYGDEAYIRALSQIIPEETVYGYILKDNPSSILKKATSAVFDECQCWLDPALKTIQARSKSPHSAVNDVEYEVLIDIALGLTDNMIAQRRYLSRRGAQNRLKSLYNKLDVGHELAMDSKEAMNMRTRAVSIAMRRGLINRFELENEERIFQDWLNKNQ